MLKALKDVPADSRRSFTEEVEGYIKEKFNNMIFKYFMDVRNSV